MHDEKIFYEKFWQSRIDYYRQSGRLFEDQFQWGYYCNKSLLKHYKDILGDFNGFNILEWGAGSGYVSCLAANDNASVSVIDYTTKAIEYINFELLKFT